MLDVVDQVGVLDVLEKRQVDRVGQHQVVEVVYDSAYDFLFQVAES
jgi:hypothetical protein